MQTFAKRLRHVIPLRRVVAAMYPLNAAINARAGIGKIFPGLNTETFRERAWRRADIETGRYPVFYELTDPARLEIAAAIKTVRRKNIRLDIIEPED